MTNLFQASKDGNLTEVLTLLTNVNATIDFRDTPLHLAFRYGRKDIVEVLLAGGADVNATNYYIILIIIIISTNVGDYFLPLSVNILTISVCPFSHA